MSIFIVKEKEKVKTHTLEMDWSCDWQGPQHYYQSFSLKPSLDTRKKKKARPTKDKWRSTVGHYAVQVGHKYSSCLHSRCGGGEMCCCPASCHRMHWANTAQLIAIQGYGRICEHWTKFVLFFLMRILQDKLRK